MKRRDTHDPRFLTFLNLLEKFKQDSNNRYLFLIFLFIYFLLSGPIFIMLLVWDTLVDYGE